MESASHTLPRGDRMLQGRKLAGLFCPTKMYVASASHDINELHVAHIYIYRIICMHCAHPVLVASGLWSCCCEVR